MSKKLSISYIGNFDPPWSTESDIRKAFEYLGHEVIQLQENKLNTSRVMNAALNSDLLLITSSWEVLPLGNMLDIFFECAKKGTPTATVHLDTFWPTKRQGRPWWRNPMWHTAYIMTADGDHQKEWKALGKNHIWLPPGVRHNAAHPGKFRPEYECDVAFVGSNGHGYHEDVWTYRRELVDNLKAICNKNGWKFKNPGGENNKPNMGKVDRGEDLNDFYASAKVTVGDSLCIKKEAAHYWSDRQTEVWSRHGFCIMPQIDYLTEFSGGYTPPMYPWGDFGKLEEMIRYYLENDKERQDITDTMHAYYKENHTYVQRVEQILKTVGLT